MTFQARISVQRSSEDVWDFTTDPSNWKDWWGGALQEVNPAWQSGASLIWAMGRPSTVISAVRLKEIRIRHDWSIATIRFAAGRRDSTSVVFEEEFTGGASMDPRTWQADADARLSRLKDCVERLPPSTKPTEQRPWWQFWR
jgi:hypothetical protein